MIKYKNKILFWTIDTRDNHQCPNIESCSDNNSARMATSKIIANQKVEFAILAELLS